MEDTSAERWERVERHKDGSVRAHGPMVGDLLDGYWEWFRADGSRMRSGHFRLGEKVGEWVTYDRDGRPHKTVDLGGATDDDVQAS